ncbi:MAG: hypothetical protein IK018_01385 [Lachnospiraceae bacterium]|nr:hypothetical protein [Lachnospiraceae bacterium]MBR5992440.1 hypothetical protein [Lachnospiraceae bacterium]
MPNPADIMKLMGMKNKFESSHPKFVSFIKDVAARGITEGDILEVTITRATGEKTTANLRVTADDVQMVEDIKNLR